MSKVAELQGMLSRESLPEQVANLWNTWNSQRQGWLAQKRELRNYVFATDTTTTSNSTLPWKNKTTTPKLCQIRDNLHANYMAALFPNDDWMKWEAGDDSSTSLAKRKAIEAYMKNKVREGDLRTTIATLLYDYIDYGNVFADVEYVDEFTEDPDTLERVQGFVGPRAIRVSPEDMVFNLTAATFDQTPKIVRYLKSLGELIQDSEEKPELGYDKAAIERAMGLRKNYAGYSIEDVQKATGIQVDGFGSYGEYLQSGYVEILELEGSVYDPNTGDFQKNRVITVIDRCYLMRNVPIPTWTGKSTKVHGRWRYRPDNLYGMGPLDNLVGMQYRIDHLENLGADAQDLAVMPPLAISGQVEEGVWGPGEHIYIGEGGAVTELGKNISGILSADNKIAQLEIKMEEMAGAPRQAMGVRTPGEKTAFEVQTLEMASSRIFQNKIQNFEITVLEPLLNKMLEVARRNIQSSDLVRVMDDDLGVESFITVSKSDITSAGKLRPVGARHFAAQAVLMQNLVAFQQSFGPDQSVMAHISGKGIAKLAEELLGLEKFKLFGDNVRIMEMAETQQFVSQAEEDRMVADATPTEGEEVPPEAMQ